MLDDVNFTRYYAMAKQALEMYRSRKEVNTFFTTTFAEVEKTQSIPRLKEALQLFGKQMAAKVNSVGLTAFGGTCSTCPCLKKLKSICDEMNQVYRPEEPKHNRIYQHKKKSP